MIKKLLISFFSLFTIFVFSQEELLDTSYGNNNGYSLFGFGAPPNYSGQFTLFNTVKLSDGKILASGYSRLARFTADGKFDTTYHNLGYYGPYQSGDFFFLKKNPGDSDFIIINLEYGGGKIKQVNQDIETVSSFTPYTFSGSLVTIKLDQQGRLYLLKHSNYNYSITRLLENGTLDTSFGTNGSIALGNIYRFNEVQISTIGDLFVGGFYRSNNIDRKIVIQKILANGNTDTTFGENGFFIQNNESSLGSNLLYNIEPDGKIIGFSTGSICNGEGCFGLVLFKLLPNGTFDSTFYNNGIGVVSIQSTSMPMEFKRFEDGKFIISGTGIRSMYAIRIDNNGNLDPTFGVGGKIVTPALSSGEGYPVYNYGFEMYGNSIVFMGIIGFNNTSSLGYVSTLRKYFIDNSHLQSEETKLNSIKVFPNPTSSFLQIETKETFLKYSIIDLSGRIIKNGRINSDKKIDVSYLQKGNYVLKTFNSESTFSTNFIKK